MKNFLSEVVENNSIYNDRKDGDISSNLENSEESVARIEYNKLNKDIQYSHNNNEDILEYSCDSKMEDKSYNTVNIENNVTNMAYFYKYSKLQGNNKNIPIHKLMSNIQKDTEEVKSLLKEGKKQRRILQSKFIRTENKISENCETLLKKVISDLHTFKDDMNNIIKSNDNNTQKIIKEINSINKEIYDAKKESIAINSLVKECENELGTLNFTNNLS